jgi:hypothetical protein
VDGTILPDTSVMPFARTAAAPGEGPTRALFAEEHIMARKPTDDEVRVAVRTLGAIPFAKPLLYARMDDRHRWSAARAGSN